MSRSRFIWVVSTALAGIGLALVSYRYGLHAQQRVESSAVAYGQATLALANYKFYERLESLLLSKCYEAALTDARELKNLQLFLLSENLRRTGNHPELVEYIKLRDPKVLETVLAGSVPEPKPYTTTCP